MCFSKNVSRTICRDSIHVDMQAPLSGEYSLQIIHNGVRRFDPPKTITVHGGKSVPSMSYIIGPDRDSTSKVQGAVGVRFPNVYAKFVILDIER